MSTDAKSHMINSQIVKKQLDQLEEQSTSTVKNKKGSTNEIQPMETNDGITQ